MVAELGLIRANFRALALLARERWLFAGLVLANLVVAIIQLVETLLFGKVVDALAQRENAMQLVLLWAVLGLLGLLVSVILAVYADRFSHRLRLMMLAEALGKVLRTPSEQVVEGGSPAVMRMLITGVDTLFWLWLNLLRDHCAAILHVILLLPLALMMEPTLALILFALATAYVLANAGIASYSSNRQGVVENHQQQLFARMGDVIANKIVLQSFSRLNRESAELRHMMDQLLRAQYPVLGWWALVTVFTRISATITMLALFAVGGVMVSHGQLTVGRLVSFVSFATLLIAHLDQLSGFFSRALSHSSVLPAFFEMLDREDETIEDDVATDLEVVGGEVRFDNVSFLYPGTTHGVHHLSFSARRGETIALVGASGSGKTTTMKLLQKLRVPDSGVILIDGQDIRQVSPESLRRAIAVVFQDAYLLNRSIRENIALACPDAGQDEIESVAVMANAHAFIMEKNGHYDFVVGERGAALSGGERQRLAIARALLKRSPILVLDEATSALDQLTEKDIKLAINALKKNHTLFVVAHRISTVMDADQILVFERGCIIENGTFDELMARQGRFYEFVSTVRNE